MPEIFEKNENEIDIKDLILSFWSNKLIIIISILISIILSGYFTLNAEKRFTAKTLFIVEDPTKNNTLSISNQISKIAGFSNKSTSLGHNAETIIERIKTRLFIENINKSVNLFSDSEFNNYNQNQIEPAWKSKLKKLIGYNSTILDPNELAWQSIINTYRKNIEISLTGAGMLSLSVAHKDPSRAAEIANKIMISIINQNKNNINEKQDNQLNYLSKNLGDALYDLEKSQSKLKEFSMKYSSLPIESFASESIRLEALKVQLEGTKRLFYAANDLSKVLISGEKNKKNYLILKNNHPVIDQVEFRRIFGQNEIIKEWSWPNSENVVALIDTLEDRKNRLEFSIKESQTKAKKLAENVENYSALERAITISQATYTVLMEQVKSNSLQAGYRPDESEIFEYAVKPINPSSPNRNLNLALGGIIGLLFGLVISLIISSKRNTFYTIPSFAISKQGSINRINKLLRRRKKSLHALNKLNNSHHEPVLQDIILDINNSKKKLINISNLKSRLSARDLARIIGINIQGKNLNVAHLDISLNLNSSMKQYEHYKKSNFIIFEQINSFKCLNIKNLNQSKDYISNKEMLHEIIDLKKDFDIVIISSENKDVNNLVKALKNEDIFHIALVRRGTTKLKELNIISNMMPIGSILYA
tara:strand:+ start:522 stop:2465 length:1944 start_codon:yes stop_codon:yes gene_type:complete